MTLKPWREIAEPHFACALAMELVAARSWTANIENRDDFPRETLDNFQRTRGVLKLMAKVKRPEACRLRRRSPTECAANSGP
jgi:hypothetical protein